MLRGYRGKHGKAGLIAAAIVVALAIGLAIISVGLARDADYQRQADYQSRENAAYTQEQIRQRCVPLPDKDKAECVSEKRHEYREDRRNERDLVAQRKSANWAYIMGAAAVIGAGLSIVGVVLVWTTFAETRRANEIASDTAKRQLRAYCSMLELEGLGVGLGSEPQFVVTVVNTGQTPARKLRIDTVCWLSPAGQIAYSADTSKYAEVTIGSGKTISSRAVLGHPLTQEQWDNLALGTLALCVGVYGEYVDIFDDAQKFSTVGFAVGLPGQFAMKPIPGADIST